MPTTVITADQFRPTSSAATLSTVEVLRGGTILRGVTPVGGPATLALQLDRIGLWPDEPRVLGMATLTVTLKSQPGGYIGVREFDRSASGQESTQPARRLTVPNIGVAVINTSGQWDTFERYATFHLEPGAVLFGGTVSTSPQPGEFVPVEQLGRPSARIYDTRDEHPLYDGDELEVGGDSWFSPGHAAVVNITAVRTESTGHLTVHPTGVRKPPPPLLYWTGSGQAVANATTVGLGGDRSTFTVRAHGEGSTHILVDLMGHYRW